MRAFIFDLFETLATADYPAVAAGRDAIAADLGVSPGDLRVAFEETLADRMVGRFGSPTRDLDAVLRKVGRRVDEPQLAKLEAAESDLWRRHYRLYPDVPLCLERLKSTGQRLALLSNCAANVKMAVGDHEFLRYFDHVVLSFEVGVAKPDPSIFALTLERLESAANQVVFLDDKTEYVDSAASLGIDGYLMCRGAVAASSRHPVVRSLTDFLGAVDAHLR